MNIPGEAEAPVPGVVAVAAPEDGEPVKVKVAPVGLRRRRRGCGPARCRRPYSTRRLEFIVAMELVEPLPGGADHPIPAAGLLRAQLPRPFAPGSASTTAAGSGSASPGIRGSPTGACGVGRNWRTAGGLSPTPTWPCFTGAMQELADDLMAVADMPPSRVIDQARTRPVLRRGRSSKSASIWSARARRFPAPSCAPWPRRPAWCSAPTACSTRYDDVGRAQFSLQNFESTLFSPSRSRPCPHGVTFLRRAPGRPRRTGLLPDGGTRQTLCRHLQGVLRTTTGSPCRIPQLDHIRREFVMKPQATMAAYGLPAGSAQALRLLVEPAWRHGRHRLCRGTWRAAALRREPSGTPTPTTFLDAPTVP